MTRRLYKAQYVEGQPTGDYDEDAFGELYLDECPEPEGWAEHCRQLWGEHKPFFPPSDRPIYRSRSSAQARVNLINRWLGPGSAILVETETDWTPVTVANTRRAQARQAARATAPRQVAS